MVYEKVVAYCNENGITVSEFERRCGLGNGVVSKWRDSGYWPSIPTLQKMEAATGVPMHEWMKEV